MALSNRFSGLERRDFRFTDKRFQMYSTETCVRKLLLKFYGDQTVGSKVIAFRTSTLVWSGETSASPNCDSTSTPRKPASGNSCKNLMAIKRSDQKLGALSNRFSGLERRDFRFTDKRFHIYSTETCVRKLL